MSYITKQFKVASYESNLWGKLYIPEGMQGKVPMVVFCHGLGETGSTQASTSKLEIYGPLFFIKNGWKPTFMVLALQSPSWSVPPAAIDYVLKNDSDILSNWNAKDCLITGLSAGGENAVIYMDVYNNPSFTYAPMSPAGDAKLKNPSIPHKTWFFAGNQSGDAHFADTAKALAAMTNGKYSEFDGGHCCWNQVYDPNGKYDIYGWGLSDNTLPANKPPISMAGEDQNIKLPLDKVILQGKGTDPDGTIATYKWRESQRNSDTPQSIIVSPSSATTEVRGLQEGRYIFSLDVTDNQGLTATDDIIVTVEKAATENKLTISDKNGIVFESPLTGDININI